MSKAEKKVYALSIFDEERDAEETIELIAWSERQAKEAVRLYYGDDVVVSHIEKAVSRY